MIDKEDYVFTLKKRILRIRSKGHKGDQSLQLHDNLLQRILDSYCNDI